MGGGEREREWKRLEPMAQYGPTIWSESATKRDKKRVYLRIKQKQKNKPSCTWRSRLWLDICVGIDQANLCSRSYKQSLAFNQKVCHDKVNEKKRRSTHTHQIQTIKWATTTMAITNLMFKRRFAIISNRDWELGQESKKTWARERNSHNQLATTISKAHTAKTTRN